MNMNVAMNKNNNCNNYNNNRYIKYNKSPYLSGQIIDDEFLNKFKIIREVEEEKEYDSEEEEKEKENNKTDNKIQNNVENLRIEVDNDNNINDIEIENGAKKKENEKYIKSLSNQYKDNNNNEENNKDLINKILFEEFPKKYPNKNKFLYKNDKEYIFGKYIVKIDNDNNNNLVLTINNEKYNLEEFEKYFCENNNKLLTKEKNKDEQINGIETTESEKSENIIKDKNENEKKNISSAQKEDDQEENDDNNNSARNEKEQKIKKTEDEDEARNKSFSESKKLKNGADSNESFKQKNAVI